MREAQKHLMTHTSSSYHSFGDLLVYSGSPLLQVPVLMGAGCLHEYSHRLAYCWIHTSHYALSHHITLAGSSAAGLFMLQILIHCLWSTADRFVGEFPSRMTFFSLSLSL